MQTLGFVTVLALALTSTMPASAGGWPVWLGGKPAATAVRVETPAEHLARFQKSLVNALALQPHQECALHRNLLAQTETALPGEAPAPAPALHEALAPVLRPDQLARLLALPCPAAPPSARSSPPWPCGRSCPRGSIPTKKAAAGRISGGRFFRGARFIHPLAAPAWLSKNPVSCA